MGLYSVSISTFTKIPYQLCSYLLGRLGMGATLCVYLLFCSNPKPTQFLFMGGHTLSQAPFSLFQTPDQLNQTQFLCMKWLGSYSVSISTIVWIPLPARTITYQLSFGTLSYCLHLYLCSNPKVTQLLFTGVPKQIQPNQCLSTFCPQATKSLQWCQQPKYDCISTTDTESAVLKMFSFCSVRYNCFANIYSYAVV